MEKKKVCKIEVSKMRVSLIKENKIKHVLLPDSISGNYWISDIDKMVMNIT